MIVIPSDWRDTGAGPNENLKNLNTDNVLHTMASINNLFLKKLKMVFNRTTICFVNVNVNVMNSMLFQYLYHMLGLLSTLDSEESEKADLLQTKISTRAPDGANKRC